MCYISSYLYTYPIVANFSISLIWIQYVITSWYISNKKSFCLIGSLTYENIVLREGPNFSWTYTLKVDLSNLYIPDHFKPGLIFIRSSSFIFFEKQKSELTWIFSKLQVWDKLWRVSLHSNQLPNKYCIEDKLWIVPWDKICLRLAD
jgi:hypothetical protein